MITAGKPRRKIALTTVAAILTLSACWHTFESISALIANGLFAANPGPAAMSSNAHNLVSVLLYIPGMWAVAALAWLVRGEAVGRLSGQTTFQQPVNQPPNAWPPPPSPPAG